MKTTITQISNVFNLLSQIDIRLFNYHFGYRYDINQNIANNFDPSNDTGRLFPAVSFDVPDNIKQIDDIDYVDVQEEMQITLYFDDLQGYNNDGSLNVLNPIEQWQNLKQIGEDFIANFRALFEDKYGAGYVGKPTFVPRANLYNDRLITWEVSFQLTHAIPCTDVQYQIDPADFPNTLDEVDLERTTGTPPTACDRIISQLNDTLLLTCVLPLYNFAEVATQNALSVQQVLDLKTWLLPQYDFSDSVWQNLLTAQQESDLTTYLLPLVDFTDVAIQAIITPQQQSDLVAWLLPLVDFSDPAIQSIITAPQQVDLQNWLCGATDPPASMIFDGVNDNIFAANKASYDFDGSTSFSFALWVKPTTYGGLRGVFSKRINNGAGYSATMSAGFLVVNLVNTDATNQIQVRWTIAALVANNWHRFLITYDGSKDGSGVNFYIDGVLQAQNAPLINNLTGSIASGTFMAIGRNSVTGSQWFSGKIEDVTIWNIELDQTQATADTGNTTTTPVELANVVFNMPGGQGAKWSANSVWTMDEITGLSSTGFPYSSLMAFAAWDSADVPN